MLRTGGGRAAKCAMQGKAGGEQMDMADQCVRVDSQVSTAPRRLQIAQCTHAPRSCALGSVKRGLVSTPPFRYTSLYQSLQPPKCQSISNALLLALLPWVRFTSGW